MADETIVTTVQPEAEKKEHFSKEYVHELREENKGWRLKANDLQKATDEIKSNADKEIQLANEKLTSAQQAANERIIRAELKAQAIAAGMIDIDGLKLADLSKVKLNDSGEIEGAENLMTELQKSKPYLFKEYKDSSGNHKTPSEKETTPKSARDMTDEEYSKAKAKLIGR